MTHSKINNQSLEALSELLNYIDPARLSRGLRGVLLEYLAHEYNNLPHDFKDFTEDLNFLFQFLDLLEETGETKKGYSNPE